ncbi:hypothetical protein AQUCO_02800018v1 [Aquilegia coerulea]|uniref:Cytochrome P450 n=1 Tax=Aquilegia coerulea TaxID=218851 RepID=A0A2G5D3J6_AQUCA|nr:hypothetical protein AQUCO_02800018v1 [Aquilegia coerulea]
MELEKYQETLLAHPFTLSCLFIFSTIILLWLANRYCTEKLNLPPSPPKLPIIGNLHQLGFLLHRSFHVLSEKYGPLMLLHMGSTPTLVVSSADMAREIKVTNDIVFANRPQTTATKMLIYGCTDFAFAPYGEYWARLRKISVMELLSNKKVQSFRYVRDEEISLMIDKITTLCSVGSPVNVTELLTSLTSDIVCRCALGRKHGGQDGQTNFGDLAGKVLKLLAAFSFGDLLPWFGWIDNITGLIGSIEKVSRDLDMFYDQIIDEHLIQNKCDDPHYNKDFVDILLQVQKDNINFTRENIKALLIDMFVGGTETTATTIEWTIAELVKNPSVMQKVQEEVRRVVGKKHKVDEEDIAQMVYLKLVVKESMRLHPAAGINVLESSKITNVKGFQVPAKTRIIMNHWSIQRDSKFWERPDEFIPERFSNNSLDSSGQDFNYTPFGSGRRICPGRSFALIIVESAIANLLYWFDWKTVGGEQLDMSEAFALTVKLKTPVHLVALSHLSLTTT